MIHPDWRITPITAFKYFTSSSVKNVIAWKSNKRKKEWQVQQNGIDALHLLSHFSPHWDTPLGHTDPFLPARPVLPIRWMYVAALCGKSQLTTTWTPLKSTPRAIRSVQINTQIYKKPSYQEHQPTSAIGEYWCPNQYFQLSQTFNSHISTYITFFSLNPWITLSRSAFVLSAWITSANIPSNTNSLNNSFALTSITADQTNNPQTPVIHKFLCPKFLSDFGEFVGMPYRSIDWTNTKVGGRIFPFVMSCLNVVNFPSSFVTNINCWSISPAAAIGAPESFKYNRWHQWCNKWYSFRMWSQLRKRGPSTITYWSHVGILGLTDGNSCSSRDDRLN